MKQPHFRFLLGVGIPFVVYLCAFFLVDPLGITGIELGGAPPFNSMQIKEKIVENLAPDGGYDGLILGTSSLMTLDLDELGNRCGRRFFNYSLFNSRPLHALAAYRHFKRINGVPASVIVGVDFFAYNDDAIAQEQLVLTHHLRTYVPSTDSMVAYGKAVGRGALSENGVRLLMDKLKGFGKTPTVARSIDSRGTLVYHQVTREILAGNYDFRSVLAATSNTDTAFYQTYRTFDNNLRDLASLVEEITSDGAALAIVLPALYRSYNGNLQKLPAYDPFYAQIQRKFGARVIDWRMAPGTERETNFIDARHIRPEYSRALIRILPAAAPAMPCSSPVKPTNVSLTHGTANR
ncbi:MAG: hypothetical protein AB1413_02965 [Thermodesulfobacteriota bacterium]